MAEFVPELKIVKKCDFDHLVENQLILSIAAINSSAPRNLKIDDFPSGNKKSEIAQNCTPHHFTADF